MHIDGDIVPSERVIAGLDTDPQIIHDIRPQNEVILGISGNSRFFNYYFRCYPSRGTELDELENYVSCALVGSSLPFVITDVISHAQLNSFYSFS